MEEEWDQLDFARSDLGRLEAQRESLEPSVLRAKYKEVLESLLSIPGRRVATGKAIMAVLESSDPLNLELVHSALLEFIERN